MSSLTLHGVSVWYGAHSAVRDVSFELGRAAQNGITALIGPSGCGKTSVLHAINRLHALNPSTRVTGTIHLDGEPTAALDDYTLRTRIGLIFQRPTPFPMSILENVTFGLRGHGIRSAEANGRAIEALRAAALWPEVKDRLNADARSLSGGQQQRLCIARAVALRPQVLLLDEPCAALDPRATALVEATLAALPITQLLVTHNLAQAQRIASRCVAMWPGDLGGAVVDDGDTKRVFTSPAHPELGDYLAGRVG